MTYIQKSETADHTKRLLHNLSLTLPLARSSLTFSTSHVPFKTQMATCCGNESTARTNCGCCRMRKITLFKVINTLLFLVSISIIAVVSWFLFSIYLHIPAAFGPNGVITNTVLAPLSFIWAEFALGIVLLLLTIWGFILLNMEKMKCFPTERDPDRIIWYKDYFFIGLPAFAIGVCVLGIGVHIYDVGDMGLRVDPYSYRGNEYYETKIIESLTPVIVFTQSTCRFGIEPSYCLGPSDIQRFCREVYYTPSPVPGQNSSGCSSSVFRWDAILDVIAPWTWKAGVAFIICGILTVLSMLRITCVCLTDDQTEQKERRAANADAQVEVEMSGQEDEWRAVFGPEYREGNSHVAHRTPATAAPSSGLEVTAHARERERETEKSPDTVPYGIVLQ